MKKELPYFYIGASYGGNQDWFLDPMMKLGGCGAETACDASVYMSLYKGKDLYPFGTEKITRKEYRQFSKIMKPYLAPRMSGIDRTDIYVEGFSKYMEDRGITGITMHEVQGTEPYEVAVEKLCGAIDNGLPVAMLTLMHHDKKFKDFMWHWYTINGYMEVDGELFVKAVSYSEYVWLSFAELWDTKMDRRGGFVTYEITDVES